jgi:hypothetical protein
VPAAPSANAGTALGLIRFGGPASDALRDAARADLAADLAAAKVPTVTETGAACTSGVTRLTNGTVAVTQATAPGQPVYKATVDITVTDCSGRVLMRKTYDHDAGQERAAVELAIAEAANAIAHPPHGR